MSEIVNKVAKSGLYTLDLAEWFVDEEMTQIDLAPLLWQGLVLKESDFRTWVKENNWEEYRGKHVAVYCSSDAIIPLWAYMLVSSALVGIAKNCVNCRPEELSNILYAQGIANFDVDSLEDVRVVIKGCNDGNVPDFAYGMLVSKIQSKVKSLMFGEPCSTVPVYKKKK